MSPLQTVSVRAQEKGLAFLLAGGHAVIVHGFSRATFDLDLVIRREDRGLWIELAQELGYRLLHEGPTFLQFNPSDPRALPLDLMFVNGETFGKLLAESTFAPPEVGSVRVVSVRHLLALKCHAIKNGHAGRVVKDMDDVVRLVQANRLDINGAEMRELFLKHGTADLYERVRKICG